LGKLNNQEYIWPGSVRSIVYLCFLLLTVAITAGFNHYIRHTLSHSVKVKIQIQDRLSLSLKEKIIHGYLIKLCSDDQDDDLKA
jgi:hypothetical protein